MGTWGDPGKVNCGNPDAYSPSLGEHIPREKLEPITARVQVGCALPTCGNNSRADGPSIIHNSNLYKETTNSKDNVNNNNKIINIRRSVAQHMN